MSLTITEGLMQSDLTDHTAVKVDGQWSVSWLPGRELDHNSAVTAMTVAEMVDTGWAEGSKNWPIVRDFARELGMTAQEAAAKVLGRRP